MPACLFVVAVVVGGGGGVGCLVGVRLGLEEYAMPGRGAYLYLVFG